MCSGAIKFSKSEWESITRINGLENFPELVKLQVVCGVVCAAFFRARVPLAARSLARS